MKKASIISKQDKPELGKVVIQVASWLRDHGYAITADAATRAQRFTESPDTCAPSVSVWP